MLFCFCNSLCQNTVIDSIMEETQIGNRYFMKEDKDMKRKILSIIFIFAGVLLLVTAIFMVKGLLAKDNKTNVLSLDPDDPEEAIINLEANKVEPEIRSAVDFLRAPDMIIDAAQIPEGERPKVNSVFDYRGNSYYYGYTPNAFNGKRYAMRILSKEQSEALLSAPDITKIGYFQSECLINMLSLDSMSVDVLPIESNAVTIRGAYYYYLEDSIVIVAVDTLLMTSPLNEGEKDSSRIIVIPKGEESVYPFKIPPEDYSFEESEEPGTYYRELFDYFVEKARINAA